MRGSSGSQERDSDEHSPPHPTSSEHFTNPREQGQERYHYFKGEKRERGGEGRFVGQAAYGTLCQPIALLPLAAQAWVLQPHIRDQVTVTYKLASRPIL